MAAAYQNHSVNMFELMLFSLFSRYSLLRKTWGLKSIKFMSKLGNLTKKYLEYSCIKNRLHISLSFKLIYMHGHFTCKLKKPCWPANPQIYSRFPSISCTVISICFTIYIFTYQVIELNVWKTLERWRILEERRYETCLSTLNAVEMPRILTYKLSK